MDCGAVTAGAHTKSLKLRLRKSKASMVEVSDPFGMGGTEGYRCEKWVKMVRVAPMSLATWMASLTVQCRLATASAATESSKVASWMSTEAPMPMETRAGHGRVSPEYTILTPGSRPAAAATPAPASASGEEEEEEEVGERVMATP